MCERWKAPARTEGHPQASSQARGLRIARMTVATSQWTAGEWGVGGTAHGYSRRHYRPVLQPRALTVAGRKGRLEAGGRASKLSL